MTARLAATAQVWLVGDRLSANDSSRVAACPKLEGSAVVQVFARDVLAGVSTLVVALMTGPTESGPWTRVAALEGSGNVGDRIPVQADRLDAFVRADFEIDGAYDLTVALVGEAKYPLEAAAVGADVIEGSGLGINGEDLVSRSLTLGPTGASSPDGTPTTLVELGGVMVGKYIIHMTARFASATNATLSLAVDGWDGDTYVSGGSPYVFYASNTDNAQGGYSQVVTRTSEAGGHSILRGFRVTPTLAANGDATPTVDFEVSVIGVIQLDEEG